MMDRLTKSAPVRAGTQAPGTHLIFNGVNRKQRRADGARKAKTLPASIWRIEDVVTGPSDLTGTNLYEIWIERRGQRDVLVVYSKIGEGVAPVVGGMLERMSRPGGGMAAIWSDAGATKASVGGGYTREALPQEWGAPAVKVMVPGRAQIAKRKDHILDSSVYVQAAGMAWLTEKLAAEGLTVVQRDDETIVAGFDVQAKAVD